MFNSLNASIKTDIAEARKVLVRKYTNYRNKELEEINSGVCDRKFYRQLEAAGAALADFRFLTKGKSAFKREMHQEIIQRRDQIFVQQSKTRFEADEEGEQEEEPTDKERLPLIACYQRALKELWEEADQQHWQERAADEPQDIHECVYYVKVSPAC